MKKLTLALVATATIVVGTASSTLAQVDPNGNAFSEWRQSFYNSPSLTVPLVGGIAGSPAYRER